MARLCLNWQPFIDIATSQGQTWQTDVALPTQVNVYPIAFPLPIKGRMVPYASNGMQKWEFEVRWAIMVGLASEPWEIMSPLAEKFIQPFFDLFDIPANLHLPDQNGVAAVEQINWGMAEEGVYAPRDTAHYGVVFPATMTAYRINPYWQL